MDSTALVLQLRYSAWASRRVLDSASALSAEQLCRDLGNSYGGVRGTLNHIYQADAIWFDRLMGAPTSNLQAYDPNPDFAGFAGQWLALLDRYVSWSERLSAADWDRVVAYHNIKGEAFQQPLWQIVLHIVNHATYHRGQITTMLRQIGGAPAGTDLIVYYRSLGA
jgi:uncharacterized damage-inducible protein DinB